MNSIFAIGAKEFIGRNTYKTSDEREIETYALLRGEGFYRDNLTPIKQIIQFNTDYFNIEKLLSFVPKCFVETVFNIRTACIEGRIA